MSAPSPKSTPVASVIIRTVDEAAALGKVLDAVLAQEEVDTPEVIVIDSGSTDATLDIVRRFPVRLHQLEPGTFTFGGALNLGARFASAPICVHLSAHCVPADLRWLQRLLAPLTDLTVVATYGRQRPIPGVNPYEEIDQERIFPAHALPNAARRYFSNANCAIRREALLARPFDETIPSMEDALWLIDLDPRERVVYVPAAEVSHSHPLRLRYWYSRYWRDGMAYQYIRARRGTDLLPERSFRLGRRLLTVAAELILFVRELSSRGYWRHLALYPLFGIVREVAVRRGMRRGASLYRDLGPIRRRPQPFASGEEDGGEGVEGQPPDPAPRPSQKMGQCDAAPRVAAVVVNYRTPHDTLLAVRWLQASQRPIQDVIVVDNGSADASATLLRECFADITLLQTGANLGFSGGCNVGIRHALGAGADLVLLVNSDVVLPTGALVHLEEALRAEPGAGIAGPVILSRSTPERVESTGMFFSSATGRMRHHDFGQRVGAVTLPRSRVVDGVSGCVMLVKREVFERIGLLAEEYFFSFEDLDFCLRARQAGFSTICAGQAIGYHEGSRSIGPRSSRRIYFATRNHLLLATRVTQATSPVVRFLRACTILALNLAHVLVRAEAPISSGLGGFIQGAWHHVRGRYGDGP